MAMVGSERNISSDKTRSLRANFFCDGGTEVAKRKSPPASATGRGMRFSFGCGGGDDGGGGGGGGGVAGVL